MDSESTLAELKSHIQSFCECWDRIGVRNLTVGL